MKRGLFLFVCAMFLSTPIARNSLAQEREETVVNKASTEQEIVVSALRTAISIIQDITRRHAAAPISEQLKLLSGRMTTTADGFGGFRKSEPTTVSDQLSELLTDIRAEIKSIARDMDRRGEDRLADNLVEMVDELDRAIRMARNLERESTPVSNEWLAEGRHRTRDNNARDRERVRIKSENDNKNDGRFWRRSEFDWRRHSSAFVGEFTQSWPYREHALYRPIPAFRYNRVEGFVLGIRRLPLDWSDYEQGRVYGQIGYAFSLEDVRYEVGAETKLNHSYRDGDFDLKLGGAYRKNTTTRDLWKSSWAENTLAAGLFRHDFFDYYETEGWTAYAVGKLTPYLQFGVGYRDDEYRSLQRETTWSLFGGDAFRLNPSIQEGQMRSVVATLEGGRIRGYRYQPAGFAFRFEAEFGKGLGGDFSFNRYVGDIRTYARMSRHTGLSLRIRGGYADGNVPVQKAFTLGGVGSVRAYSQNVFYGTRMLLANVEYTLYRPDFFDDLFEDLAVFGLFDAGWTNTAGVNEVDLDDVFSAAGFGVSLDDRNIRLEIAWPLKDLGMGTEPSVWLRLNPTF